MWQKYIFDVILNSIDRDYFVMNVDGLGNCTHSKEKRAWEYPSPLFKNTGGVYIIWLQGYGTLFIGRSKNLRYYLREIFGFTLHSKLCLMGLNADLEYIELLQSKIIIIPVDGINEQKELVSKLKKQLNPKLRLSCSYLRHI